MPSPHSASRHAHTLNLSLLEQKTITLSGQEAPVCSTQQDVCGVSVFLFQKKNQTKTKTIQTNKTFWKKRQRTTFLTVLISFFLLPGKLFLPFFSSAIPTTGSPFNNSFPGSPSISSHQALLGLLTRCTAGTTSPLGKQNPLQKDRRSGSKFTPESLHCLLPII